jgi:hypothetical protein
VLKDVIGSRLVPVVELQEVYRQARESLIVANAHRMNRGEMPITQNDAEGDFFFFERTAPEDVLGTIKQLVQNRLVGRFGTLLSPAPRPLRGGAGNRDRSRAVRVSRWPMRCFRAARANASSSKRPSGPARNRHPCVSRRCSVSIRSLHPWTTSQNEPGRR